MSDKDRSEIKILIEKSLAPDHATIDWQRLRENISSYALDEAKKDAAAKGLKEHKTAQQELAGHINDFETPHIAAMNRAKAEVLGIIPESQWDKSKSNSQPNADPWWVQLWHAVHPNSAIGDFDKHKFACSQPGHTPGHIDPTQSFSAQHVTCKATKSVQR